MVPILVVGVALALGLVLNRRVRPFADSEIKGVKLEALVNPLVTLAVLVLAFTLVNVFASFQRASQGASDEARKVDFLYELGGYTLDEHGPGLQAATACYAAAVASHEWETMAEGRTASQVSPWTRRIRGSIDEMVEAEIQGSVLSAVLTADKERGEARSRRLTEARPSLPTAVFGLLVAAAAVGIFSLATFTLPYVARRVQVPILVLLAVMLALLMACTLDMDRPYNGLIAIGPTDMERVAGDLTEEWAEAHDEPLPCEAGSFERSSGTEPSGDGEVRTMFQMALELFAEIHVRDFQAAKAWYVQLLGESSFVAHDTEEVWELAENRSIAVEEQPENAGHGAVTILVDDLESVVGGIVARGIEPTKRETYGNGVRKVTFHDPDGNEIGFGGAPV